MAKQKAPAAPLRRKKGSGYIIVRHGKYELRWREDGKVKQEATGLDATKANLAKAEELLAKKTMLERYLEKDEKIALLLREQESIQDKIRRLQNIAESKPALTLGGLVDAFSTSPRRKDCSEKQLEIYEQQLGAFVKWTKNKDMEFAAVDDEMAEKYAAYLGKKFSGGTYNKHLNTLTLAWRALGKTFGAKTNPWAELPRKRLEAHTRRILTDAEIAKILKIAKGETRDLIIIGLRTGLRLGDASRLKWEAFMKDGTVVVPTSKTGATVRLPSATLLRDLTAKPKKSGYILPETAEMYERNNSAVSRRVTTVFKAAGIDTVATSDKWKRDRPDATFHSLRHTFVTKAISAGVPVAIVRALVGHTTETMTEHYTHVQGETVADAFLKAGL